MGQAELKLLLDLWRWIRLRSLTRRHQGQFPNCRYLVGEVYDGVTPTGAARPWNMPAAPGALSCHHCQSCGASPPCTWNEGEKNDT
jgi:hypothetical protein